MKANKLQKIYKDEWVLVEVLKKTADDQPLEVKVLAHGKEREEIYDALLKMTKKGKHLATIFTGSLLKEGYAAAFILCQKENTNSKKKV